MFEVKRKAVAWSIIVELMVRAAPNQNPPGPVKLIATVAFDQRVKKDTSGTAEGTGHCPAPAVLLQRSRRIPKVHPASSKICRELRLHWKQKASEEKGGVPQTSVKRVRQVVCGERFALA